MVLHENKLGDSQRMNPRDAVDESQPAGSAGDDQDVWTYTSKKWHFVQVEFSDMHYAQFMFCDRLRDDQESNPQDDQHHVRRSPGVRLVLSEIQRAIPFIGKFGGRMLLENENLENENNLTNWEYTFYLFNKMEE